MFKTWKVNAITVLQSLITEAIEYFIQGSTPGTDHFDIRKSQDTLTKVSMHTRENYDKKCVPAENAVGNVLRAGCDSPPAVIARHAFSPRALVVQEASAPALTRSADSV